jgi:hypothetical protein
MLRSAISPASMLMPGTGETCWEVWVIIPTPQPASATVEAAPSIAAVNKRR